MHRFLIRLAVVLSAIAFSGHAFALSVVGDDYYDVNSGHQFYQAISFLNNEGIIGGYPDGSYKPGNTINRAELLKILIEAEFDSGDFNKYSDDNCFSDVKPNKWFTKYICFAEAQGFINGYDDGTFRPGETINLVEALKMMLQTSDIDYIAYADPWYEDIVDEAADRNLIPLTFTNFNNTVLRGEMADMLTRIIKYKNGNLNDYLGKDKDLRITYAVLNGDVSHPAYGKKTSDTTSPGNVTNLYGDSYKSGEIYLDWYATTDNVGVAGYEIHYGTYAVGWGDQDTYENIIDVGDRLYYTIKNLTPGEIYYISVIAYDAAGNESLYWSNEVVVKVQDDTEYYDGKYYTEDTLTGILIWFIADDDHFPDSWANGIANVNAIDLAADQKDRSVDAIFAALNKYPDDLLSKKIDNIHVVDSLEAYDTWYSSLSSGKNIYLTNRGFTQDSIEQSFHREFLKILFEDYEYLFSENDWNSVNSDSFSYGIEGVEYDLDDYRYWQDGFLGPNAKLTMNSDIESYMNRMFMPDEDFWYAVDTYAAVNEKYEILVEFFNDIDPLFNDNYFRGL